MTQQINIIKCYIERLFENPGVKSIISMFLVILNSMFGNFNQPFRILLILIAADLFTGLWKAIYYEKLTSRTLRKSLWKLIEYLIVIFLTHQLEGLGIKGFRDFAIFWAGASEGISIFENLDEIGITVPEFVCRHLKNQKKRIGEDKDDI